MDKFEACGLEISARELVVAWSGKKAAVQLLRFANDAAGHRSLLRTLTRGGKRVRVVMEATGLYGLDVALALSAAAGVAVMVANPRAVRNFARAMMQRSKNDPLDALVLREFALRMPFRGWQRPSANRLALWAIARRLKALSELCSAEKNRLHAMKQSQATPAIVRQDIVRNLRWQERAMNKLRREARQCIAAEAELQRRYQLMLSAPGIAERSALQILGELVMLPEDRDVRQWVAFAGLDPSEHSSGQSVRKRPRLSKAGNRHLRQALYMPALVCIRWEPHLFGFYQHLLERGKAKKQALLAVARKLLHALYGMFRHNQPYDGTLVYRLPAQKVLEA